MSFAGHAISGLGGVFGRTLRAWRADGGVDANIDPYEPVPMRREDLTELFDLRTGAPLEAEDKLRASERLEHDTMSMLRGALYSSD